MNHLNLLNFINYNYEKKNWLPRENIKQKLPEHVLWNFSEWIPIESVQLFPKFLLCFLGKTE